MKRYQSWQELIKSYMERDSLNANEVAKKAGLSCNTICGIVNGKTKKLSPNSIMKLVKTFGIPEGEFDHLLG